LLAARPKTRKGQLMTTSPEYRGTPDGLIEALRDRLDAGESAEFATMIDALRVLQDRITAARPPEDVSVRVAGVLSALSEALGEYAVDERAQIAGHLATVPGRGQAMTPVVEIDEFTPEYARGHVRFGRFYLGGNGAVHGGAIPLAFDELMGRLANTGGRVPSRTAYLHVNYRSVMPIEKRLSIEARFASEEGRKRILSGSIRDGALVCADAEGLFVALRPGQP
jgi:acyl-coenzyme A thioesterase PaaI-like protein